MLGITVIVSALLPLRPSVGDDAVRIVRHGLRDVLEWLGEDVGPAPGAATHSIMSGDGTAHGPKVMFVSRELHAEIRDTWVRPSFEGLRHGYLGG